MLKSRLCYYSDAYILVKGTITITGTEADPAACATDGNNKPVMFKYYVPFCGVTSKINITKVDNSTDLGIVVPAYNVIEYSDN